MTRTVLSLGGHKNCNEIGAQSANKLGLTLWEELPDPVVKIFNERKARVLFPTAPRLADRVFLIIKASINFLHSLIVEQPCNKIRDCRLAEGVIQALYSRHPTDNLNLVERPFLQMLMTEGELDQSNLELAWLIVRSG
jgi:hypothetical protein